MKAFNNMKLAIKLTGSFLLVALVVLVVAVVGFINLKKIDDGMISLYINRTLPIQQLGFESTALYTLRGDVYKSMAIPVEREASLKAIQVDISVLEQQKSFYDAGFKEVDEKAEAANFSSAWTTYKNDVLAAVDSIKSGNEEEVKQSLIDGPLHTSRAAAATSLSKLIEINRASAEALNTLGNATFEVSITILVVVTLAGLLLAIGLGLFLSRNLANAIKLMVKVANQISQTDLPAFETVTAAIAAGDLTKSISVITQTVNSDSKDEIGDLARAFNAMIIRLQGVGKNFSEMIANLSSIVGQVAENATTLDAASGQLSTAANQAGQATSQISVTIQQVASGISQQTESVSRTAASVDEMGHAIETVARGAQEQAKAVAKASTITSKISAAVQQVTASAQISAQGSNQAADTARSGAETVEGTIRGMQTIKRKVGISANKVQEMGMRSDEIGAIVETIDDIASQTNLLALNAAIEAARAGEHGKGFAVVADEVRKLAERSSNATKEIGKLIRGIQQTMAEAVTSIEEVTHEVESGVERASQSEEALKSILNAVEAVNEQVEQIAAASQHISVSADELVAAVDTVSAVVQENTAATQHMSVDLGAVTQAIENIASVSEENSASVEEVSASTEEMSAQVEEVSASAQTLAEMAKNLTEIVAQFRLAPGISSLDGELPSHSVASKPTVQGLGGNGNSKHQPDGQAKPVLSK